MRIRKFEASSVQEALQQVRQELGPDAVILYTRKIRRGGFLGLGSLELAEVTAGVDLGPETSANGTTPAYTGLAERGAVLGAVQLATSTVRESPSLPRTKPSFSRSLVSSATGLALERRQEIYQSELNDGKVLAGLSISRSAPRKTGPDLHPELRRVMDLMIKNGVEESVAQNALMPAQREIVEKGYPRAGTLGDRKSVV